ncbi:unnamed protein product [Colias eurytheme]|nr:unnamed protein product [Colias eurytheme]
MFYISRNTYNYRRKDAVTRCDDLTKGQMNHCSSNNQPAMPASQEALQPLENRICSRNSLLELKNLLEDRGGHVNHERRKKSVINSSVFKLDSFSESRHQCRTSRGLWRFKTLLLIFLVYVLVDTRLLVEARSSGNDNLGLETNTPFYSIKSLAPEFSFFSKSITCNGQFAISPNERDVDSALD